MPPRYGTIYPRAGCGARPAGAGVSLRAGALRITTMVWLVAASAFGILATPGGGPV